MSLSLRCFYAMLEGIEREIVSAAELGIRHDTDHVMGLHARAKQIRNRINKIENPDAEEAAA